MDPTNTLYVGSWDEDPGTLFRKQERLGDQFLRGRVSLDVFAQLRSQRSRPGRWGGEAGANDRGKVLSLEAQGPLGRIIRFSHPEALAKGRKEGLSPPPHCPRDSLSSQGVQLR